MEPDEIKQRFQKTIAYLVRCYGELGVNEDKIVATVLYGVTDKNISAADSMHSVVEGLYELTGSSRLTPSDVVAEILGKSEEDVILQAAREGTLQYTSIAPWLKEYMDGKQMEGF